ncbi:hypothetical protein RCL1_000174 [Eukaryota sp. TZLM3-RCL]
METTFLLSSSQANLIAQFESMFPTNSQINSCGVVDDIPVNDEEHRQLEFNSNPIAFICSYPSEVYSRFGNRTKFIGETKGSCLELSNDDCLIRSSAECQTHSFIAINHPLNGSIKLTLMHTRMSGGFSSYVGYFHPLTCQDYDFEDHFSGINPYCSATDFFIKGLCKENITSKLSISQSIIISFSNREVTFSTPHSQWSITMDCPLSMVFGIVVCADNASWFLQ